MLRCPYSHKSTTSQGQHLPVSDAACLGPINKDSATLIGITDSFLRSNGSRLSSAMYVQLIGEGLLAGFSFLKTIDLQKAHLTMRLFGP